MVHTERGCLQIIMLSCNMEKLTRIARFELQRDFVLREFKQGHIGPELFTQLLKEISDYYCQLAENEKEEK